MANELIYWSGMFLAQAGEAAAPAVPWFRTGFGAFALLVAVVAAAIMLARLLASSLRMPEYQTRLAVIIGALALGIFVTATGWPPRLGVDLKGGFNFVGQLNLEMFRDQDEPESISITAEDIIPRLLRRVDPGGTKDVQIRPVGNDRIEVTIPDVDAAEAEEIWGRLVKTGLLQFRIVCDRKFHSRIMGLAEQMAASGDVSRNVYEVDSKGDRKLLARWYSLAREEVEGQFRVTPDAPFKFIPGFGNLVRDRKTGQLINMADFPLAGDASNDGARFAEWLKGQGIRTPQVLMLEPSRELLDVEGRHLKNVRAGIDEFASPCVNFELTSEGSRRMYSLTSEFKPQGADKYKLGIILDDSLHNAPEIEEPIDRSGRIHGRFTSQEVEELTRNLESGKLEVALHKNPISKSYLASTLGAELRDKGIYAIIASLVVVMAFMLVYYRLFCGGIASLVLLSNVVLVLGWVIALQQPLSLTGLAGLVLIVGMAVDANVLIFERIREELQKGASLRMSIRNGFDKASTTIVDSNLTTLITAVVLYGFGTEQIKGFSITLILGILMSMFTAVYCARAIFEIAERKKWITRLTMMQIMRGSKIDFLGKTTAAVAVSILLIVVGLVSMFSLGSEILDIDLRGGSTARVVFKQPSTVDSVRDSLRSLNVQHGGRPVDFQVTALQDTDYPERVFKIDSNLPTYEENAGERWEQLDEIINRTFAGKLRTHNVEIESGRVERMMDGQWVPVSTPATGGQSNRAPPVSLPGVVSGLLWSNGNQDENAGDASAQDAVQQSAENQDDPNQENAGQDTPQDSAQDDLASSTPAGRYRSTVHMTFADPISGQAITTFLVEAAVRIDTEIEEDAIGLQSDEIPPDESVMATAARTWEVTLETARPELAQRIVESWQQQFNGTTYFPMIGGVGGQVAKGAQWQAFAAVIASLIGIVIYIWVRFQSLAYSFAAVVALIHDVLVVLGAIAISHYVAGLFGFLLITEFKISLTVMAAILTVIGYSLNDTIVIFDRVRETRGKRLEMNKDMINLSLSQTLSRTMLTSFTTFVTVLILYIWGGDTIHGFAFCLVVGIFVGTYSSLFIASPLLLWLMNRFNLHDEVEPQTA